jgi:hypothetical protein
LRLAVSNLLLVASYPARRDALCLFGIYFDAQTDAERAEDKR